MAAMAASNYQHLLHSKRNGFTSVELMLASVIFLSLIGVTFSFTTSSLQVGNRENQQIELQQNVRIAMQLITQDIRSSSGLHVLNTSGCPATKTCSNNNKLTVISAADDMTLVRENTTGSYNNSVSTRVCDARKFHAGDTALVLNVVGVKDSEVSYDYLDITGTQLRRNRGAECRRNNSDLIFHNQISGSWTNNSYISKAVVATYSLEPDPLDQSKTVLYRETGIGTTGPQTGIVAFNINDLMVDYGIQETVGAGTITKLIFYPSLEAAAAALGSSTYSSTPDVNNKQYIGDRLVAIRVTIVGESRKTMAIANTNGQSVERKPAIFSLTQTVELRR